MRAESSERPSGPPRLALPGSKPTWRERQAQKEAEAAAGGAPQATPATPATDIATTEVELPKKTGYVPPALRDGTAPRGRSDASPATNARDGSSGGDAPPKWRPSAPRDGSARDGSPANAPAPRFLAPGRRGADGPGARDQSPADGPAKYMPRIRREGAPARSDAPPARTESPANRGLTPGPGKFVPPHLRNK